MVQESFFQIQFFIIWKLHYLFLLSWIGSNVAGEYIFDKATKQGKRVQANLAAKNHATILSGRSNNVKKEISVEYNYRINKKYDC